MSNPNYNNQPLEPKRTNSSLAGSLIFFVMFLIIIGFLAIFSAGAPKCTAQNMTPLYFVGKQFTWFILGCIAAIGISRIPYKYWDKLAIPMAWSIIGLLICVKLFGVTVNGATRWLAIGPFQFQPSEIAKFGVVALLASAFSKSINLLDTRLWKNYFIPILIILFLVYKQPNLSMVAILGVSSWFMYFCAGGNAKIVLSSVVCGFFGILALAQGYQKQRIETWLHPDKDPFGAGYNIIQAMMAFVSGGFFGVGYGDSRQKLGWLPEGHTDFIFAVFAEEFGFLGCILIIGLFLAFLDKGLAISKKCEDSFGRLLAAGITISITFQAFINICVSSSMIPATGVPLPFISYGGTSLFITMCMVGVLLNISKGKIRRFPNVKQ